MGKSPLIVLNDTSQNLSVGYYMDIEAHNLTSEVYMRSLSLSLAAVFFHLVYSCCKMSSLCWSHCSNSVVEAPSCSPFYFPPSSVNRHHSRCAYCKVIVNDLGK